MATTPDRISYSYGVKLPGAEDYSSITVNASLSTDVQEDESADDALQRARLFVQTQIEKDFDDIQRIRSGSSRSPVVIPDDEDFAKRKKGKGKG